MERHDGQDGYSRLGFQFRGLEMRLCSRLFRAREFTCCVYMTSYSISEVAESALSLQRGRSRGQVMPQYVV